jgi:MFS family permease
LADRHGARNFATLGLVLTGMSLIGLQMIPINFTYPVFALLLLLVGLSMGLFAAPNTSAVMNSLPANRRGAGGAMLNTFQNSASVLSIGFFFTVIVLGLSSSLPHALLSGLTAQGVPTVQAVQISHIPAIGSLFSAFLGINPMQQLLGAHILAQAGVHSSVLLGRGFFPSLIEKPFARGLHMAFLVAAGLCFVGAVFSWLRGPGLQHHLLTGPEEDEEGFAGVGQAVMAQAGVGSPGAILLPDRDDDVSDTD